MATRTSPTPAPKPERQWAIVPCETSGCRAAIRYPVGEGYTDIQPCKWCREKAGLEPPLWVRRGERK